MIGVILAIDPMLEPMGAIKAAERFRDGRPVTISEIMFEAIRELYLNLFDYYQFLLLQE